MSDIVAFLNARLDEDEAIAKAAAEAVAKDMTFAPFSGPGAIASSLTLPINDVRRHMARHDPARVLLEVAAKRALLAEHDGGCCVKETCCGEIVSYYDAGRDDPCPSLMHLAAGYSDHADYDPAWAAR